MHRDQFRENFNWHLTTYLTHQLEKVKPYIFCTDLEQIYWFILPYSEWGKRIRPYIVYMFYKLCGWTNDNLAYQAGMVNELIHLFALIHDDIADKWTMRHHKPSFQAFATQQLNDTDQWINMWILVWDVLLSRSLEYLHTLSVSNETKAYYFEMLNTTIYWQIQDIYLSFTPKLYTQEIITQKDEAKSWNYSFMRPMLIWASLAWLPDLEKIHTIGERLWLAFQMRDDLLDIIDGHGDKTPFSDHQEGNQTYVLRYAYDHATDDQKAYLLHTRWKPCDSNTQKKLLAIYHDTGTIDQTKKFINDELNTCQKEFTQRAENTPTCNLAYCAHFQEMINFLLIA